MTYYICETMDGRIIVAQTSTWFGEELPKYIELYCPNCGKTYSRDILRLVRPDVQENCTCGAELPQMRHIKEMKGHG